MHKLKGPTCWRKLENQKGLHDLKGKKRNSMFNDATVEQTSQNTTKRHDLFCSIFDYNAQVDNLAGFHVQRFQQTPSCLWTPANPTTRHTMTQFVPDHTKILRLGERYAVVVICCFWHVEDPSVPPVTQIRGKNLPWRSNLYVYPDSEVKLETLVEPSITSMRIANYRFNARSRMYHGATIIFQLLQVSQYMYLCTHPAAFGSIHI